MAYCRGYLSQLTWTHAGRGHSLDSRGCTTRPSCASDGEGSGSLNARGPQAYRAGPVSLHATAAHQQKLDTRSPPNPVCLARPPLLGGLTASALTQPRTAPDPGHEVCPMSRFPLCFCTSWTNPLCNGRRCPFQHPHKYTKSTPPAMPGAVMVHRCWSATQSHSSSSCSPANRAPFQITRCPMRRLNVVSCQDYSLRSPHPTCAPRGSLRKVLTWGLTSAPAVPRC